MRRLRLGITLIATLAITTVGTLAFAAPAQAATTPCWFSASLSGDDMVYKFRNCHPYYVGIKVDIIFAPDVHPVLAPGGIYTKRVDIDSVNQVRDIYIITKYI
jgi:hypothetical protein